jgi:uncharacterized protein YukE
MGRPAGEPGTIAAGSRGMGAAAGALREVRGRLRGATSFVVTAGAWRGPASEAFQVDGAALQTGLDRAAEALDQAAGALSELAARLEHAQATWDRARRLAATVGVDLDRLGGGHSSAVRSLGPSGAAGSSWSPDAAVRSSWNPDGGVRSPADAVDPAAMLVGGQAATMAAAAEQEAAAARRVAAARLDRAATHIPSPSRGRGPAGAGTGAAGGRGGQPPGGKGHGGAPHDRGGDRHEGPVRAVVSRVLEFGAEVATATHHLTVAAEARVRAAARLAATADDPAVRAAAARVAQEAGRPLIDGRALGALPLVAPVLTFTASVSSGEPLPRALAGAVGSAVGADLGSRAGMAACGGEAAATQGAGLILCPTLAAIGGAVGAEAGERAALHVYDKLAGPPVKPGSETRPEPTPGPGSRPPPEPPPGPEPEPRPESGG